MEEKETGGLLYPPDTASSSLHSNSFEFLACGCKVTQKSPYLQILCEQICADAESRVEVEKTCWENEPEFISENDIKEIEMYGKNGEINAYTKQGLLGLIGSQKQGKTTECYAKALSLINGEPFAGFTPNCTVDRIMLVDTEQTPSTISKKLRTFRKQLKRPTAFQVLSVKHLPVEERLDKVAEKCELYNPEIVFVDGIVDMVEDFNDQRECKAFFERIGKLATDRLIVCLLHTNKTDKTSPRGHLGTILSQKAEETYQVKKENGVFKVYVVESRHADTTDAQPMTFAINKENGFLIDSGTIVKEAEERERNGFYENFKRIFGDDIELRHKDILLRLKDRDNLEKTAAGNKITKAVSLNVLKKLDPDNAHSPYALIEPETDRPF